MNSLNESNLLKFKMKNNSDSYDLNNIPLLIKLSFVIISFGYMLPWTSLGSLISYYKQQYGPNFYLSIYIAYYLPGLPIAVIQYTYDEYLDRIYTSQKTYLYRGLFSFSLMAISIFNLIWIRDKNAIIAIFILLGISGWLIHGTACQLASMFPKTAIANLQIGFRLPEIYTIIIVSILYLNKNATASHLLFFYLFTGFLVFISLICWILVIYSNTATKYFIAKDDISILKYHMFPNENITNCTIYSNQNYEDQTIVPIHSNPNNFVYYNSTTMEYNNKGYNNKEDNNIPLKSIHSNNLILCNLLTTTSNHLHNYHTDSNNTSTTLDSKIQKYKSYDSDSTSTSTQPSAFESLYQDIATYDISNSHTNISNHETNRKYSVMLSTALMITIWSSIFQAAFFAYVKSNNDSNIEQKLYFARLLSDLFGRSLTYFPRPFFVKTSKQLLIISIIKSIFIIIFFLYIFLPHFPRNDVFILSYVALFSLTSGYMLVLLYEYAAKDSMSTSARVHSTIILNMSFQVASFTAVLMSVLLSLFLDS